MTATGLSANGDLPSAGDDRRQRLADGRACLDAALDYLRRGWSILALCPPDHVGIGKAHGRSCESPGKAPWGAWKEFQDRLPTEAELQRKWRDNATLNVGLALGPVSGLVRVDVDGEGGERRLQELSAGDLPPTLEFRRGPNRGLLYAIPDGAELRTTSESPTPGEELRFQAKGAQTVLPPSRHPGGDLYQWAPGRGPDEIEPAPAPAWLLERLRPEGRKAGRAPGTPAAADGGRITEPGRNTKLTSLAGTMRRRGMSREAIEAALLAENAARCDPPLGEDEVRKIAASVAKYAPDPRAVSRSTPAPGRDQAGDDGPAGNTGYDVIKAYFLEHYQPRFRRGTAFYSEALGREVKPGEATFAPGMALVLRLLQASDVPKIGKTGVPDRDAVVKFFRTWAGPALQDLLDELPEEDRAAEVVASAEEAFRERVALTLLHHVTFGHTKEGREREQRRTLLDWCRLFAKPARWQDVRGYQLWCRTGDDNGLQVALRSGLFGQVHAGGELARLTATKFTRLAELYAVGEGQRVKGVRSVVLAPGFIAYVLAQPAHDTSDDEGASHPRTHEGEASKCHTTHDPPGGQGFSDDTSDDTSCAGGQSVMGSVTDTGAE